MTRAPQLVSTGQKADDGRRLADVGDLLDQNRPFDEALAILGRELIAEAIRRAGGDEGAAASRLKMSVEALRSHVAPAAVAASGR